MLNKRIETLIGEGEKEATAVLTALKERDKLLSSLYRLLHVWKTESPGTPKESETLKLIVKKVEKFAGERCDDVREILIASKKRDESLFSLERLLHAWKTESPEIFKDSEALKLVVKDAEDEMLKLLKIVLERCKEILVK